MMFLTNGVEDLEDLMQLDDMIQDILKAKR